MKEFLGEAERRLQYRTVKDLLIVIWLVFFTVLCAFGFYAGKKDWKKEHGPILDEVKRLKAML